MKRFLFLLLCALFISTAFLQCKRCKDKSLGDRSFTQTDLNIVPYYGTETLIFKDTLNDSVTYKGYGRSSLMITPQPASDKECTGDYYNSELNHTQFLTNINHRSIDFYLGYYDSVTSTAFKYVNIGLDFPRTEEGRFQSRFYFNNLNLIQDNSNGRIRAFDDSLTIGPKKFYSVYTLGEITDTNKIVYYSVNKGIVGFVTSDGHLRYLAH
jgi:hypothetical protein